jgi:hypothetical protein
VDLPQSAEQPVITGHFGLAAGAQAAEPRAPLWSLMLATMWLDVIFLPLFLTGVETIDSAPLGVLGLVAGRVDPAAARCCAEPAGFLLHDRRLRI